ncbi:MAG: SPOR domain-containing protein [Woeseiaceae bacterium]
MRNLLLLLLLANILYFIWGIVREKPPDAGVVIVNESELGPPLELGDPESAGAMSASSQPSVLAAAVGRSCVSIGPFTNSADAERVLQDYRTEGMRAAVRSTDGQLFVGHWVQIRNVPSRDIANNMIKKLVAGGLADAYLLPEDAGGLSISLGLFGDMARAERVELQAESLDLPAEITPRMRDAKVFYVDIALPPGRGAGAMIGKYGEDKVLLRHQATCPTSR